MYAVVVNFRIKPNQINDFLPLMRDNAATSLKEETGCRTFDIWRNGTDVFLYEIYDDAAAFQDHLGSDHFKTFDAAVAEMIAQKEVRIYEEVVQ